MRRADRRGLTLLEVVLALVIIGMGIAVLTTAASRCLAMVTASRVYHEARYALELAELKYPLVQVEDELVNREVAETEIVPGYTFSRTVETPEDYEDTGLFLLRNRVTWEGTGSNTFEETLRYCYFTNDLAEADLSL